LEEEQRPHPKKNKKTIPDIFCDYVLVFQRQVEQLIQRRHGCDETKRDTEMKIEREEGSEEALLVRRERNSANSKRREETKQQPGQRCMCSP